MEIVEDAQVDELRRWADGLAEDSRPEVKAAAKAILMLAEDLAAARSQLLEERLIREALEASLSDDERGGSDGIPDTPDRDLAARLRSYLPSRRSRH